MMAAKTLIFIIALLGVSISLVSSDEDPSPNPNMTEAPDSTTISDTTPNTTSSTPSTTASTPNTDPTQTTPNGTTESQTTTVPPTTPELTTTPIPTTTPPQEVGTWTVWTGGSKNQTCMKMSLKGTITKKNADPILIPTTAVADSSSCSDEQANFVLQFEDDNVTSIAVTLNFVMQNEEKSYLWASSISNNGTTEQKVQILFETPIGKSYQCDEQIIPISDTFNLTLEEFRLQPFASFANHDFGESFTCEHGESSASSGPQPAVIVGLVEGTIIIILLIAVVILYRKKKGPGRGYNNFT